MTDLPDFKNRHFLVVDDEEYMSRMIIRMLKDCHAASVNYADDGIRVLQMATPQYTPPDCIISDFNMKHVTGLQLLQAIRAGMCPGIPRQQPFIMVTGHGEQEVVKAAISLDVSGFAVKPIAQKKLIAAVSKALSQPVPLKSPDIYKAVKVPKP